MRGTFHNIHRVAAERARVGQIRKRRNRGATRAPGVRFRAPSSMPS
jgi:hypothetical protein